MLNLKSILTLACCLNIVVSVSSSYAKSEPGADSDYGRVLHALENDQVSNDTITGLKQKKTISLVCPSGEADNIVFNKASSIKASLRTKNDRFDISPPGKPVTVFLSCKENTESIWHKYVLVTCSKTEKKCLSGAVPIKKDSATHEPVVSKDGRLYAKVSVIDTNLLFCPDKKPIKILGLTQRDGLWFETKKIGEDVIGLQFFSKKGGYTPKSVYYPLTHSHLKFDVQCGDDPAKELWVKPIEIPGRMLDLK